MLSLVSIILCSTTIIALVPATKPTPDDRATLPGTQPVFPHHAPPQPWNQFICRDPLPHDDLPEMHLTFSFGEQISRASVALAFQEAKHDGQVLVDLGYGNRQIESPEHEMAHEIHDHIYIIAKRFRRRLAMRTFTVAEALRAVNLLEHCWNQQDQPNEMWAYVFIWEQQQIGYITLEHFLVGTGKGNGTVGLSSS
ncbi:MAG: hypothetical protein Q9182_005798 [Xanthomendoza sp. 2 TL-2023]